MDAIQAVLLSYVAVMRVVYFIMHLPYFFDALMAECAFKIPILTLCPLGPWQKWRSNQRAITYQL